MNFIDFALFFDLFVLQTLHYQLQKQRDTHGVGVDLLMIDRCALKV